VKIRAVTTLLAAGALVASCGETTTTTVAQVNLDRPVDIAFSCWGGLRFTNGEEANSEHRVDYSAQPLSSCDYVGTRTPSDEPRPKGQGDLGGLGQSVPAVQYYGFVLQQGPGTVALVALPPSLDQVNDTQVRVLDADPLTPGINAISVGEDPIAIAPDTVGCYQIVANAGTCDLSVIDVGTAVDNTIGADSSVTVNRLAVKNAAGEEILARPAAMVGSPPGGEIGFACPAQPTGVVYIAYPSCHLVAAVDSATGTIVSGIDYSSGTPTITDGNVSCPAECGGGGTFTAGIRPTSLDLDLDPVNGGIRLLVGAENSSQLTLANIGAGGVPASLEPVLLEDTMGGAMGVTAVAIGPQIGTGGSSGSIDDDVAVGGQFQFVYAIATDHTVRVADVLDVNAECDTNIDPRLIDTVTNVRQLSCFPVGDPSTPARRANARGPGIHVPGTYHDVVPTSIDIVKSTISTAETDPEYLIGYFAMVSASNGSVYIIDVDDDNNLDFKDQGAPLFVQLPLAISHHLRDAIPERDRTNFVPEREAEGNNPAVPAAQYCDNTIVAIAPDPDASGGNKGGVRAVSNPTRNVPTGFVAAEKVGELPSIRQVQCTGIGLGETTSRPVSELSFFAPDAVRDIVYQDLIALNSETWTMTWEGTLSIDSADTDVDGPPIRVSQVTIDELGMHLVDPAKPFCDAGVEQWDIVQMRGCDPQLGDGQCPVGYTCFVHPESQVTALGACMLEDEAERLADACKDYLTSLRRYTVGRSSSGELRLLPRRRQLNTTPLDGCTDNEQCTALADYAKELSVSSHPSQDTTEPNERTYECLADPDRPPLDGVGQTGKRCIEVCEQTSDCSLGSICREGICMEGVIPPQSCVNAPQRYEMRAHDAFAVIGSRSGYVHSTIRDAATDRCVADPAGHPFEIGRIPLSAPPCDPAADERTGRLPDGTFGPNPCSLTMEQVENVPNYTPGTCELADPTTVNIVRQAPAIRFRGRGYMIHLVDPTYPGDNACIKDGQGTLAGVPMVFPSYQLTWRQTAGFTPLTVAGIKPAYPVKVVRGPIDSIWVIDEGDFLSTSINESSTRGKVFRVDPRTLGTIILE
jgi:hypothetical protein